MDNRLKLISLYDYYGELLTEKQKGYFEDYYFNNLTLAEIGDNYEISRNAVHKQLKDVENKLNEYENILNLLKNKEKILKIIDSIDNDKIKEIKELI